MYFIINIIKTFHFFLILIIYIDKILSEIKDYYSSAILENEDNYLVDVKDYHDLSIIISTSKNIYTGIPPLLKSKTNANIYNSSSAATYNENYILMACLSNSLLSKININTGLSISLLNYSDIEISISPPSSICSISIYNDIIFLFISKLFDENNIQNIGLKFNILNDINEGPIIDNFINIKIYHYPEIIPKIDTMRQISCEVLTLKDSEDYRLVCANEIIDNKKFIIYFFIINENFDGLEVSKIKSNGFDHIAGIQLFKINKYYIRCLMRNIIFDKYLKNSKGKLTIAERNDETKMINYNTNANLYCANNNYIFSAKYGYYMKDNNKIKYFYFAINKINKVDYFKFFDYTTSSIRKIMAYYNEENDNLIFVSQYKQYIKYFILNGIKEIFNIISHIKTKKINSNTETIYDVSDMIESSIYFAPLSIEHSTQYIYNSDSIINYYEEGYRDFPIDNNNHLYIYKSDNKWIDYNFAFIEEVEKDFLAIFYLPNAKLIIQTCDQKCLDCPMDFNKCGLCRNPNYAILNGDENDNNCYPINQLFNGYIYSPITKKFEKCYISCKFCFLMGSQSSSSKHNCLVCAEGYYPSYVYFGNCYKINDNDINKDKYVSQITDEIFTNIDSCNAISKLYKIESTGECINECPFSTPYYSYTYTPINFDEYFEQEINTNQFILNSLLPPKYIYNYICYENCPSSIDDECIESINQCNNAWYKNIETGEINCFTENYCLSNEYKYYVDDTKECRKNECPYGYYQLNFQCYKNGCPPNTNQISSNSYKCESIYNFCYINEYFQTICSEENNNNNYKYKYDNTNQYLKNCEDSLIYTILEVKTYLYNGICYLECPKDITNVDEDNKKCICKYFVYYYDENNYICYNEEEICGDKIPVVDLKVCVNSINNCKNESYKIFNNKCYSNECPELTKLSEDDNYTCICKYLYYNDISNNKLNCFTELESCENKNYLYSNPDTNECFNSLEDCFSKNNLFYFNYYCYKDNCPSGKISLSSITNEIIKNILLNLLLISNELIDKICICDIYNFYWTLKISSNLKILMECSNNCEEGYEPELITRRCIEKCNPEIHFIFNNECFTSGCPEGTELDPNNINSRTCICKKSYYRENNLIICCDEDIQGDCKNNNLTNNIVYPKEDYENQNTCLAIYNNKCYSSCPEGTKLDENNINSILCVCQYLKYIVQPSNYEICLLENELCPEKLPYEILSNNECVEFCSVNELLNNTCRINNIFGNLSDITQNIKNLINDYNYINHNTDDDIIILGKNIIYEIVTSKNNDFNNITSYIDFGECEARLKDYYNIDYLLIFKYDIKVNNTNPTIVQYEVFNPYNKDKLNLSICEETKIDIYIPASFSDEFNNKYLNMLNLGYDILNKNNKFYNDICSTYTENNSTDITLSDRRKKYYSENYTFCEKNCEYINYDINYKMIKCECSVETEEIESVNEVIKFDKNDLGSYFNIKTYTNLEIIKCFKLVFSKKGQILNYGSYILIFIISIFIILFFKYCYIHNKKIKEIIFNAYNYKTNNFPPKKKVKIKIKIKKKIYRNRLNSVKNFISIKDIIYNNNSTTNKLISSKSSISYIKNLKDNINDIKYNQNEQEKENNINKNEQILTIDKSIKTYTNSELNIMEYLLALYLDKRYFIQYYFSLLQKGHILLLVFVDYNDYNLFDLKLILFLFSFSLYFIVNALFFTDKTMHKIYEDNGAYNLINKLPGIIYSSLITTLINILIKCLALSEGNILKIRKIKDKIEYAQESEKLIKILKIKFSIFLILNNIFLIWFWYYISAFCAVYKNTQKILIKDTLLCFAFSFLYPFIIYLIPSILRFISLKSKKKNKEYLYKISILISKI